MLVFVTCAYESVLQHKTCSRLCIGNGNEKKNKVKIEIDKLKQKEETYYYGTDLKLDVVRKGLNVAVTVFVVTVCLLQTRDFYRTHREIYTIL